MQDYEKLKAEAETFARQNKNKIAEELTDISKFIPNEIQISAFMAGSPGAGKTEFSRRLLQQFLENTGQDDIIRIDSDDLRGLLPGYTGSNSAAFQYATSVLVDKIHDCALANKQSFILDGTMSRFEKAKENIERSLSRNRTVLIFYVYQDPMVAWRFTQERERIEHRNIPKSAFVEQFIGALETIKKIRFDFNEKVLIFLVKKNFETHSVEEILSIMPDGRKIDDLIGRIYTKDELDKLL